MKNSTSGSQLPIRRPLIPVRLVDEMFCVVSPLFISRTAVTDPEPAPFAGSFFVHTSHPGASALSRPKVENPAAVLFLTMVSVTRFPPRSYKVIKDGPKCWPKSATTRKLGAACANDTKCRTSARNATLLCAVRVR